MFEQELAARARTADAWAADVALEIVGGAAADGETCVTRRPIAQLSRTAAARDVAMRALATSAASALREANLSVTLRFGHVCRLRARSRKRPRSPRRQSTYRQALAAGARLQAAVHRLGRFAARTDAARVADRDIARPMTRSGRATTIYISLSVVASSEEHAAIEATLREVVEALAPIERAPCSPGEREAAEWLAEQIGRAHV